MDGKRQADFDWQAKLMPEVKKLCAPYLICEATPEEDMKHNTDLMILPARVSVRLRKYEDLHKHNYANEFTIRASRPRFGTETELTKVISGWGDYNFYGFASADATALAAWFLGDLKVFRKWFNHTIVKNGGKIPAVSKPNPDGSSEFYAFTINDLPDEFVVARVTEDMSIIAEQAISDSTSYETHAASRYSPEEQSHWGLTKGS